VSKIHQECRITFLSSVDNQISQKKDVKPKMIISSNFWKSMRKKLASLIINFALALKLAIIVNPFDMTGHLNCLIILYVGFFAIIHARPKGLVHLFYNVFRVLSFVSTSLIQISNDHSPRILYSERCHNLGGTPLDDCPNFKGITSLNAKMKCIQKSSK